MTSWPGADPGAELDEAPQDDDPIVLVLCAGIVVAMSAIAVMMFVI